MQAIKYERKEETPGKYFITLSLYHTIPTFNDPKEEAF